MRKIIEGDVDLGNLCLTELSDLSDVEVMGSFACHSNYLTSLEGCPHTVSGYFSCTSNNLTSLEGCPHTVYDTFYCGFNQLTSLKSAPQTVDGSFHCTGNNLTSLEGIPKTINVSFYISKELKDRFPEEYIRSLSKIKGDVKYS